MYQRVVTTILLVCFAMFEWGCYTLKTYKPEEVKPDWEVAYVIKTNGDTVRYDDEDQGSVQGKWVIGSQRNSFAELRPRRVPVDSVDYLLVRRPDTSSKGLIIAGVGAAIGVFVVIAFIKQDRSRTVGSGAPSESDTLR
jgi:hypothetical protein